jgi:hypothetical protein
MSSAIAPVEQLITAIYVSSSSKLMSEDEIIEILRIARQNNERRDITGMLLYRDGNFLQVLEGPAAAVDDLIARIKRDARHHGVIVMSRRGIAERQFSEWRMAFRNISKSGLSEDNYSSFLEPGSEEEEGTEGSQLVFRLLRRFKDNIR